MKKTIIGAALLRCPHPDGLRRSSSRGAPCGPLRDERKPGGNAVPAGTEGQRQAVYLLLPGRRSGRHSLHYVLENGAWVSTGQGTIFWEEQEEENTQGVFSLLVREDRSFVLSLHGMGTSTFQSDPVTPPEEPLAYTQGWLEEEREIQLGEEIPVAFFVADSGTSMPSFTVEDYFTPESFQGMDTVQAVTLTFSQQP